MSHHYLDPYAHHQLLAWARTDQARRLRRAAEERLAAQVRPARRSSPLLRLVLRLRTPSQWLRLARQDRSAAPAR
jgi:hypothetical protein